MAVIVVIGGLIRLEGLTKRELWFDESCTFYAVHNLLDWPADGPDPQRELAHLPYFFALHLWTRLVGETPWGLRSFSAIAGCAGLLVIGCCGARIGGRGVGLVAAALAAVHPLHVYYSQEARVYTMWSAEAALCLYLLYQTARSARLRWWIGYAVLAWMTVLTHYYTLLWLPATVAAALVADDRRRWLRRWLVTHVALGLALLPVVWLLIIPFAEGGPKPWLRETWAAYPPGLATLKSLWALLPSGGYPHYLGPLAVASESAAGVLGGPAGFLVRWGPAGITGMFMCVLLIMGRLPVGRRVSSTLENGAGVAAGPSYDLRLLFLLLVSAAFLVVAWCHSWLGRPAYLVGRYDLAVWPSITIGIALLVAAVGQRLRQHGGQGRPVDILATVALVGCSALAIIGARAVPVSNDLTERARRITAAVGENDLIVSLGMYRWFMTYEWHRSGFTPRVVSFPAAHDRQLCWYDAEAELEDETRIAADVNTVLAKVDQELAAGGRVWLVAHGEPTGARWDVDRRLYARLAELGIDIGLHDEWTGLAELIREPRAAPPAIDRSS